MTFKISSEKIEEFIEKQHAIDGMVSIHDFELWLEEQPKVDGKDTNVPSKWIPCSERLPENHESVIFTTKDGTVECGWYDAENKWCVNEGYFPSAFNFIAWMPLPEPYKEQTKK